MSPIFFGSFFSLPLLTSSENLTRRLCLCTKHEIKDDIIAMSISNREFELADLKKYTFNRNNRRIGKYIKKVSHNILTKLAIYAKIMVQKNFYGKGESSRKIIAIKYVLRLAI